MITWLQNCFIWSRTALTLGITSLPSTSMGSLDLFLRATCSTARDSVKLIFSPENILSLASSRPLSLASIMSRLITSSVTLFLL